MPSFSVPYVCSTLQMGKLRHKAEGSLAYGWAAESESASSAQCPCLLSHNLQLQKSLNARASFLI